ncbi:MAG: sigma-70 family RNA polymerase sigma factor [Bacteroidetes bacterium]|nr:sigma-70 family RNA polymerase sigma factor [Bacteroidota bacterium]
MKKIIAGCIRRNVKSQKDLYDRFAPLMLSLCYRYAKNKSDAKDIFQEGFLKVFENIRQLRNAEALGWWMKRIFVNEAFKFYKKQTGLYTVDNIILLENISDYIDDNDDIINKMETDQITRIIQNLPERMRMVFNMYIIEGFSHQEIADMLGISAGTSKSHLHDARKQLQHNIIIKRIKLYG